MKEDLINLPFFIENGFIKRKCKACGKIFWTLNSDMEYCGDQPCVDYMFIDNPIRNGFSSLKEVREAFINFFRKNNHGYVKRYPVVARWRDDVFLVGASIYDFQPWVTEGLVNPPSNPLVISQPSIRLTDVDNVGRTGRHLTGFEMMAHHAFNIKGVRIYWVNETVEYAFNLLIKVYKIPPEEISFKFDWWSGGGNAGEDYEVLVRGLEVATLVFMHYKLIDDKPVEMKNKIVDTGYGLERIYWLLKGTSTIYESVFGDSVKKLIDYIGLEPIPKDLMFSLARKMGKLDYKEYEKTVRIKKEIALMYDLSLKELDRLLRPYESVYAALDHARTVLWMIGDGIVPSNVGAGYLARLLIRRGIRHLRNLKVDLSFCDLVKDQMYYWRNDFPEYLEIRDEILDIVNYEEMRYKETVRRGKKIVRNILSKLSRNGVEIFPIEDLVMLYDSHGITPDIVEEVAGEYKIKVDAGLDFYSMLAERHEKKNKLKVVEDYIMEIKDKVAGISKTVPLYYIDARLKTFRAKVVKRLDNKYIVLDRTAFYPEGGGQPADIGKIFSDSGVCDVEWVGKIGDVIVHKCKGVLPEENDEIIGIIDYERRRALMRNHTATHIILGAAKRILGRHIWQTGAQKGVEQSRLDITHHKKITREELEKIEYLANKVIMENRRVNKFFMDRIDAESKYGFTLYQGGVVPEPVLRIVEIEGWDVEACGGVHCDYTGEIGLIKIVKIERIQDGVSRIIFRVGESAIEYTQSNEKVLENVSDYVGVEIQKLEKKIKELLDENKRLKKEVSRFEEYFIKDKANELLSIHGKRVEEYILVIDKVNNFERIRDIAIMCGKIEPFSVVLLLGDKKYFVLKLGDNVLKKGLTAVHLFKDVLEPLGWKGGGSKDLVQGIASVIDIEKIQEKIVSYLESYNA